MVLFSLTAFSVLLTSVVHASRLPVGALEEARSFPGTWRYHGCWTHGTSSRALSDVFYVSPTAMTVESCIRFCAAGSTSYVYAGLGDGRECYCGGNLSFGAVEVSASECYVPCTGQPAESCGAGGRLNVYRRSERPQAHRVAVQEGSGWQLLGRRGDVRARDIATDDIISRSVPVIRATGLPGNWQYKGCFAVAAGSQVLPYEIDSASNTVQVCLNQCAAFGFPAAGLANGTQCFCGDVSDVTGSGGKFVSDSQCNVACAGDATELCGASHTLSTYYWQGSLNVWNTPKNTGRYEFLVPGVVVPLLATLGINNKVAFLEKHGPEFDPFPNSTGAYELDISLADNFSLAWREMHVKTNVFCSSSIVLPDKAGRQINVGGWTQDAAVGVRLYIPDGKPGVNGTNDWEENVNELKLQRARWYATSMMMPNGSILTVGGTSGAGGPEEPTLEILPKPSGGDTVVTLDYLQRTAPNNLYPYLMVLPSGRFFIGYYNEARIMDPVTFATVAVLPNMPGGVNDTAAGRSYPMSSSAVLLPLHAPYTDPIGVLICGGSTTKGSALDNCVSIAPEAKNPTWTLERMPSRRVIPCMVTLPDGTYLIINGAQWGFAGFATASEPNQNAVLYDPSQPVGQRMSILASTTIARMYHSEATLLPDGRVLISGSDPLTNYPNGTAVYPEETRIEVFIPPYLSQGFKQPTFTIGETDWNLGGQYPITVTLFQGTTSTMQISLVAASSSTHGNVMSGGRIIFPKFSCSGNTCTITAPPNAFVCPPGWHQLFVLDGPTPSHSAWVRIGGDPAKLGNWPNFPDFTLPGV